MKSKVLKFLIDRLKMINQSILKIVSKLIVFFDHLDFLVIKNHHQLLGKLLDHSVLVMNDLNQTVLTSVSPDLALV